ncbi:hypothetical protein BGX27_005189 [Mortierella sp. AM989]|nr:hypothetical protein BGX27_005189 [Mortierella sp. AM989]
MADPWVFYLVVGIVLQTLGLTCYYFSEKQRKEIEAEAAARRLVYVIPIGTPTESLPVYGEVMSVASPPPYDTDMTNMAELPTRPLSTAVIISIGGAPPAYLSSVQSERAPLP